METSSDEMELSDDSSSSGEEVEDFRKTTTEERVYNTIPGSDIATKAALAHHGAYANPVPRRGPSKAEKKSNKSRSILKTFIKKFGNKLEGDMNTVEGLIETINKIETVAQANSLIQAIHYKCQFKNFDQFFYVTEAIVDRLIKKHRASKEFLKLHRCVVPREECDVPPKMDTPEKWKKVVKKITSKELFAQYINYLQRYCAQVFVREIAYYLAFDVIKEHPDIADDINNLMPSINTSLM